MPSSINCIDNKTTDSSFFVEDTDNAATTSNLDMRKSRLGGAVNSGDTIGNVRFMGFDGADYQVGARIFGITDGTIGLGQMPTDLFFSTAPNSVSSDLLRMTIASTGEVTIAAPDSGTGLTIGGGGEIITAGNLQVQAGNIFLPDSDIGLNVGVYYLNGLSFIANWGTENTYVGQQAGIGSATGIENTGIGTVTLGGLTTGSRLTAVGSLSGNSLNSANDCTYIGAESGTIATSGNNNTSLGSKSLNNLDTGSNNIAIGYLSGTNYTGAESSNIIIGNNGTLADVNTIRIGTQGSGAGQQNSCFIAGISGVSVSNLALVSIDTVTGQLGSTSGGSAFLNALDGDTGTATPSGGIITIAGGTGISTAATASTVTVNLLVPVSIAHGGTNATSFATTDGTVYYDGTRLVTTATGSSGQVLTSNGVGLAPTYQPASAGTTTFNTDSGSATPSAGTITFTGAGGITTSGSGSTVTITGSGSSFPWTVVTGATQAIAVNNGYIANNAGTCVMTLPSTAAVGSMVRVTGINNATGWKIAQNSGQTIYFGDSPTTTGATGFLASSLTRDSIELVCVVANNDWNVLSAQGNIQVN